MGLLAEIAPVDEEQNAPGAGVFHQPISKVDRGKGLARAGRHLDQGVRLVGGEGLLEVLDRLNLRFPQVVGYERWQLAQPMIEPLLRLSPLQQSVRLMKSKNISTRKILHFFTKTLANQ